MPRRRLHIAMIGQKGLPATYGGVEHVVSETGRRLVDRGHRVTVYARTTYGAIPASPYLGMDVVPAATVASKSFDAIVHSVTSTSKAMRGGVDVFHYHALGPGLLAPMPRYLSRGKVVLTVHGLDHERSKWGLAGRSVLGVAHWLSGRVPDETVVVSRALEQHYADRFNRKTTYIPNGVTRPDAAPVALVEQFGLRPGRYVLFVGRIVPEKAPDMLIEAFRHVDRDVQLAIVGDTSWTDGFTRRLREQAAQDSRVVLTGYAFGETLRALYEHAGVFTQPSTVEGLPLTLLEAASHQLPLVVSDIPPHLEVLGGAESASRRTFPVGDREGLTAALAEVVDRLGTLEAETTAFTDAVLAHYNWDAATDRLEQLYLSLVEGSARPVTIGQEVRA